VTAVLDNLAITFTEETHEDVCDSSYGCSKAALWDLHTECCPVSPLCQEHRDHWEHTAEEILARHHAALCGECRSVLKWWNFVPHRRNR
jgi:hypothetical protein